MIKLTIMDNEKEILIEDLTDTGREIIKSELVEMLNKLDYPFN